jgi:predicted permease
MAVAGSLGAFYAHRAPETSDPVAKKIMDTVLWVFMPFVLFFNLVHFQLTAAVGTALGLAYIGNFLVVGIAYVLAKYAFKLERAQVGAVMVCSLMGNTAYLGYPFVSAALGFDALPTAVSYDILVSMSMLLLVAFSIGASFGTHADTAKERFKSYFTKNPVLYAAALALVAPASLAPDWAVDASRILVLLILPLGFFAVGIVVRHESEEDGLSFPPKLTGPIATTVILRLSIVPGFLLLMNQFVAPIPDAYVLEAMMSVGVNNLLLANNYGLDRKITAGAIVWSTMVIALVGLGIEFF